MFRSVLKEGTPRHGAEEFFLSGLTRICICFTMGIHLWGLGLGKAKVSDPLQLTKATTALLAVVEMVEVVSGLLPLPTWSWETKEFYLLWFHVLKWQKDSPPHSLWVLGSILSCSIFWFCATTIHIPTPNIPQSRALSFQHLKGFDILAFFPMKQQVLTGHVFGAATCMPQVDWSRPRMKGGGAGEPESSYRRKEDTKLE